MKRLIMLFSLLIPAVFIAHGQTSLVTTHRNITITTDPDEGVKKFIGWGVFPKSTESVRKITMLVTLGSPDSLPTAHWDYLDHILLKRAGGINGKLYDYELGRIITPYGSIFGKGWKWTWSVDVTDFSLLLRDSAEIEYSHSGYEPATVGWSLSIAFEIQKGPEVMVPMSIKPMWNGGFRYGDPENAIENTLKPIAFSTGTKTDIARFRIQQTGHGMDEPKGCSEFCSRWREVVYDKRSMDHTVLWKNCGNNPLYPQGGTWIYDRADWCPGDLQQPRVYDLAAKPGQHNIEIKMEPYSATGNIQANESIASFIIEYKQSKAVCDIAIEQIIVPNNNPNYSRMNPAISNPVIIIRNLGRDPLLKANITYGTKGFDNKTLIWTGNLGFNKTDTVVLPGNIDFAEGENNFSVSIKPVGKKDAWLADNALVSTFAAPPVFPEKMILQFLANNKPEENDIAVVTGSNDTVFAKTARSLQPKTLYYDTLHLPKENYCLKLTDKGGDGLEFWYEPESGYGYMRLLSTDGRLIHNFESDNGDGQYLCFSTSPEFRFDTLSTKFSFVLFPRRTKGVINLDMHADKTVPVEVLITSDGRLVEKHSYTAVKTAHFVYDVSYLPAGRYIIEVVCEGQSRYKRRFNKE